MAIADADTGSDVADQGHACFDVHRRFEFDLGVQMGAGTVAVKGEADSHQIVMQASIAECSRGIGEMVQGTAWR